MTRQLTFDLPVRPALGRDDFFVSPDNALALSVLENWQNWPNAMLVLVGPKGAGKTHLAHVWAAATGARMLRADDLQSVDLDEDLRTQPVIVEDIDTPDLNEEALFHLHNFLRASGCSVLFTSGSAPAHLTLRLPDLASRLEAVSVATLDPPGDELLRAVLLKQFADRQLSVPPNLVPYLLGRIERSFAAVQDIVATLDDAALAQGRPVSRALAASILDKDTP